MQLLSRATDWNESRQIGRLYLDLLRDSTWNLRRVDTIELLDHNQIGRKVSIDIDLIDLKGRLAREGISGVQSLPLPIFTQVKTLMLDLDLRQADGMALSLATSAQDSWIAYSMLLCVAEEHGFDPSAFSRTVLEAIYHCARHMPDGEELNAIDIIDSEHRVSEYWISRASEMFSANEERVLWESLFAVPQFAALAADFTLKSMAICPVDVGSGRTTIVKYRYVDVGIDPVVGEAAAWGVKDFAYFVPAESIGLAQREHTRIIAPEGMEVTDIALLERASVGIEEVVPFLISPKRYHRRLSGERGVVYTRRYSRGSYVISVSLQPRVEELVAPSLFSVGLTSLLLAVFTALQFLHSFYFDETVENGFLGTVDTDSLTTTLLLVPTLLSLFLVRPREHSLVGRLLLRVRILVLLSAFCMIISASAVALGLSGVPLGLVFGVGFLISTVILVILVVAYIRSRKRSEAVRTAHRGVLIDNVLISPLLPN